MKNGAADNAAQLKVVDAAAMAEATETARRTRLDSKTKLELAERVASQRSFDAVQSIQRTGKPSATRQSVARDV